MFTDHFLAEEELVTPPLNGLILPGVTRKSILELAREWVRDVSSFYILLAHLLVKILDIGFVVTDRQTTSI